MLVRRIHLMLMVRKNGEWIPQILGPSTHINLFVTIDDYQKELELMKNISRQQYVAHLRRYTFCIKVLKKLKAWSHSDEGDYQVNLANGCHCGEWIPKTSGGLARNVVF